MMIVIFDKDREWYIRGATFDLIVESMPAGMITDDDLALHLLPASAMSYLNIVALGPERGSRISAALQAGVNRCLSQVDEDRPDIVEFYKNLLTVASGQDSR
ncbi:hypothetical protein [Micromonospora tarensis]|uniref:Uncharacterized protein n=1 Tax=Micromonospora tarensis TaxID=2806100 RepID=A0ABS1YBR6_9ACTN|nr:hypothetical protein [Micromonospora tarensis]MBM0274849.1 hypothetical protein [Micromonospora tarensis]